MAKVSGFVKDSVAELKRVTWPTKRQVWHATLVVVVLTCIMGVFLGLVDGLLTIVFNSGFAKFIR